MKKKKGKFIVVYGANNLGKTEQAKRLVQSLKAVGFKSRYIKYPIYDLEPTGPKINAALRKNSIITNLDLQKEFAQNRRDFEPQLVKTLNQGTWVVAEDYKGTGIAWGITYDIPLKQMEKINAVLLKEDFAVLLDGDRFTTGIEPAHRHEQKQISFWNRSRKSHKELAERYGWKIVNANQTRG